MAVDKIENVKCTLVAATEVRVKGADGSISSVAPRGEYLVMKIDPASKSDVQEWAKSWASRPSWRDIPAAISLRKWYKARTLDQLALLWSLVKIMAMEQEGGKHDKETMEAYYLGLIEWYAPRVKARLPDGREREVVKTASQMNSMELSKVIEGAFAELSNMGVHLETSNEIKNYYVEWRSWRGQLKEDGLEETYQSLEEYRQRIPFCEATLRALEPGEGHLAHIVSKGSGGADEPWNFLHLSADVHLYTQHTKGWVEMLTQYPHLIGKVNAARVRHGLPTIKEAKDLWDDLVPNEQPETRVDGDGQGELITEDASETDAASETPERSGERRLWFHPETDSYVVSSGQMGADLVEIATVPTDTLLGFTCADLVGQGKMKRNDAVALCNEHGIDFDTYAGGAY